MSTLGEFLVHKRAAVLTRRAAVEAGDDAPGFLGHDDGRGAERHPPDPDPRSSDHQRQWPGLCRLRPPGSLEIQLGVLGSCLSHVFLIQAADRKVEIDELSVEVTGQLDPRAGQPGIEHLPVYPHDIAYTVRITSPASGDEITAPHGEVKRVCPIFNLLREPQAIRGVVVQIPSRILVSA